MFEVVELHCMDQHVHEVQQIFLSLDDQSKPSLKKLHNAPTEPGEEYFGCQDLQQKTLIYNWHPLTLRRDDLNPVYT